MVLSSYYSGSPMVKALCLQCRGARVPALVRELRSHMVTHVSIFRASLVAQLVKNPPAMQETWVRSLGWEDPLEKGKATHSSILVWRTPWTV